MGRAWTVMFARSSVMGGAIGICRGQDGPSSAGIGPPFTFGSPLRGDDREGRVRPVGEPGDCGEDLRVALELHAVGAAPPSTFPRA